MSQLLNQLILFSKRRVNRYNKIKMKKILTYLLNIKRHKCLRWSIVLSKRANNKRLKRILKKKVINKLNKNVNRQDKLNNVKIRRKNIILRKNKDVSRPRRTLITLPLLRITHSRNTITTIRVPQQLLEIM